MENKQQTLENGPDQDELRSPGRLLTAWAICRKVFAAWCYTSLVISRSLPSSSAAIAGCSIATFFVEDLDFFFGIVETWAAGSALDEE